MDDEFTLPDDIDFPDDDDDAPDEIDRGDKKQWQRQLADHMHCLSAQFPMSRFARRKTFIGNRTNRQRNQGRS